MRIERGDHAADRLLHQLVVVDVVDVLALDALVDLSEQPGLFPGALVDAGLVRGSVMPVGHHVAPAK